MYPLKRIAIGTLVMIACFSILYGIYNRYFSVTSKLDHYVQAFADSGWFSGAVLVAKDGKILLAKAYGMANLELDVPNTVNTKFRIASITKQFTAMAIMQLYEMRKLDLQDPLSKYISDYPNGEKITIHHLLTHTSGITNVVGPDYKREISLPHTLESRITLFKNKPFEFAPGQNHLYSDSNYILLTYIIEKASGKSYEKFLQTHIFDKLSMIDTGCDDYKRIIKNRAAGYSAGIDGNLVNSDYLDMSFEMGAGMLYSTLADMYRWDRALYSTKLVTQESLDKIFTPYKDAYAYGWHIEQSPYGKKLWHDGKNPGVLTLISRYVDRNACIIVLSNFDSAPVGQLAENLAHIIFGQQPEYPKKQQEIFVDPAIYDRYVGTYIAKKENLTFVITKEDDKLYAEVVGQEKYALHPISETEFFIKFVDAHIIFSKNVNSKQTMLNVFFMGQKIVAEQVK